MRWTTSCAAALAVLAAVSAAQGAPVNYAGGMYLQNFDGLPTVADSSVLPVPSAVLVGNDPPHNIQGVPAQRAWTAGPCRTTTARA
jgi:hypothetical protein